MDLKEAVYAEVKESGDTKEDIFYEKFSERKDEIINGITYKFVVMVSVTFKCIRIYQGYEWPDGLRSIKHMVLGPEMLDAIKAL